MNPIRLLDFGFVSPLRSQTVYHAAGRAMSDETADTIILVSPNRPYVCIGYHQDAQKEVDLDYCRLHRLLVLRREVGGGAVYLDAGQVFVQWVFHRNSLPAELEQRFELYIRPLVGTYRALGISAYLRPVNDIHVAGKKIGGTGAAQIGEAEVVVGSLMFTFDKAVMARVLKVPSEKMRDKVFQGLEQYMTTMQEQLGYVPDREATKRLYIAEAAASLSAEIIPGKWTPAEETVAQELDAAFASDDWLSRKGSLRQVGVKIHEDVRVLESAFKAPGGLIRITAALAEGRIADLSISGDFTLLPAAAVGEMEKAVQGLPLDRERLATRLRSVYVASGIRSPGVAPEHFAEAIATCAG